MTPTFSEYDDKETYTYRQPNLTYRLGEKTIAGKIDKLESVKQAIYHIIPTERFSNPIYDGDCGIELEQYMGKYFGHLVAGIENTLREALCQDDRITDVQVDDVSRSEKQNDACIVEFTVFTIYGNLNEKLSVVQ